MFTRRCLVLLALLLACVQFALPVAAHEARPAYLQITEIAADRYEVVWRTPLLSGQRLPVVLQLPAEARELREPIVQQFPDSLLQRSIVELAGGLAGKRIDFPGLQATITDVLVRFQTLDGAETAVLVQPSEPWLVVPAVEGGAEIAGAFLLHGVEHILEGVDHLLFVFALLLIVRGRRALFWSITAFTLAHSITLGLATLGFVSVPSGPVEATIALSIVLLASEVLRVRRGLPSITAQRPWLVAFCFGLLHGFGFAGALTSIGLPAAAVPLALLFFNLGIELGQLLFVAAIMATAAAARLLFASARLASAASLLATYAIGALASFWFLERVAALLA